MPRYRVHYTHPDGVDTTGDYESETEVGLGDVIEVDGERWQVQEVEPFGLGYDGYIAVERSSDER